VANLRFLGVATTCNPLKLNLRFQGVATTRDPLMLNERWPFAANLRFYVPLTSTNPLEFGRRWCFLEGMTEGPRTLARSNPSRFENGFGARTRTSPAPVLA